MNWIKNLLFGHICFDCKKRTKKFIRRPKIIKTGKKKLYGHIKCWNKAIDKMNKESNPKKAGRIE